MSATARASRYAYFRAIDRRYAQPRAVLALRALARVAAGAALLWAQTAALELALLVMAVAFLLDSAQRLLAVALGWTTQHFRPMNIALIIYELSVVALILFWPAGAVGLLTLLSGALLIIRGLLIVAALPAREAGGRWQRRMMLASAVFSAMAGLILLLSMPVEPGVFAAGLGLWLGAQGTAQLLRLAEREEAQWAADLARETAQARATSVHAAASRAAEPGQMAALGPLPEHRPQPPRKLRSLSFGDLLDTGRAQRPLVVLTHPDDLEGFCGGLVYSLRAPAISVLMTGGDKGRWRAEHEHLPTAEFTTIRLGEAAAGARLLGVEALLWMGYTDRAFGFSEEAVGRMLALLHELQPDLVITFEYRRALSYYPHADHLQTGRIVREAVRRYAETGARVDLLLTGTTAPNAFLDVTQVRRIKLEALACHTTQDALNAIIFPFFERLVTSIWGAFCGVESAEGYRRIHPHHL